MDRIFLSEEVGQYILDNINVERKEYPPSLPLLKGTIILPKSWYQGYGNKYAIGFDFTGNTPTFTYMMDVGDEWYKLMEWELVNDIEVKYVSFKDDFRDLLGKKSNNFALTNSVLVLDVLLYISTYKGTDKVVKSNERIVKSKKGNKRKGKKSRKVYLNRVTYTLNEPPSNEGKREYNRVAEAWSVRGHWRTYKNGKKVWIKPHIRGEKGNIEGKDYML